MLFALFCWMGFALGLADAHFGGFLFVAAGQAAFNFSCLLDQSRVFDEGAQTAGAKFVGFVADAFDLQVHVLAGFGFVVGVADRIGAHRSTATGLAKLGHTVRLRCAGMLSGST